MTTSERAAKLDDLARQMNALEDQRRVLEEQFYALEPSIEEFIASCHGKFKPHAHYDAAHDILHFYFEDRPSVTSPGHHMGEPCIAYDYQDGAKAVGATWWGFRAAIERKWAERCVQEKP